MERFIVAADALVEAYGDVSVRGHFGDPGLAAAAFADIKNLMSLLEKAGLDGVAFTGADVAKLIRMESRFHEHTCGCLFCFGFEDEASADL